MSFLTILDEEVYNFANKVSSILNGFSHNKVNNLIEAACWPDDLKAYGLEAMNDWHFIDLKVSYPAPKTTNFTYINDDSVGTLVIHIINSCSIKRTISLQNGSTRKSSILTLNLRSQ